jgi:hypothetical protein
MYWFKYRRGHRRKLAARRDKRRRRRAVRRTAAKRRQAPRLARLPSPSLEREGASRLVSSTLAVSTRARGQKINPSPSSLGRTLGARRVTRSRAALNLFVRSAKATRQKEQEYIA